MATSSKRELAWDRLQELEHAEVRDRHIDLCLELFEQNALGETKGDPFAVVGGRWDTFENRYVGEAEQSLKVSVHPGQVELARWWVGWLATHLEVRRLRAAGFLADHAVRQAWNDNEPVVSALIYGGRRWGKSWFACLALVMFALAVPGARIVAVSPTQDQTRELIAFIEKVLTTATWRDWLATDHTFEFGNGSRIEMHTARKSNLKIGPVDLALVNEGQETDEAISDDLAGCLIDYAGGLLVTCNPPRARKGYWVRQWFEGIESGERLESVSFFADPRTNPHVPRVYFDGLRRKLGNARYRREVLGDMRAPLSEVVFEQFDEAVNLLPFIPVEWRDVTPIVTAKWFEREADRVVGADFDKGAGCHWVCGRFFCRAGAPIDQALLVVEYDEIQVLNEVVLAQRLAAAKTAHGFPLLDPARTVVVADASGRHQNTARDWEKPASWNHLEAAGWLLIRPDPEQNTNPRVWARIAVANQLLRRYEDDTGHVHGPGMVVLGTAPAVLESLRQYPAKKNGEPVRTSEHAHPADCWTYIAWRRWGRDPDTIQVVNSARRIMTFKRPAPSL